MQCFVAGLAFSLLGVAVLGFLGRRWYLAERKRNPDFFTNLDGEMQRRKPKSSPEEAEFELRHREIELMERIVKNQEVMIELLRQSLSEKPVS
jgi:hypothetical protein